MYWSLGKHKQDAGIGLVRNQNWSNS